MKSLLHMSGNERTIDLNACPLNTKPKFSPNFLLLYMRFAIYFAYRYFREFGLNFCKFWVREFNFAILVVLSLVQIDMYFREFRESLIVKIFAISDSRNSQKLNHREIYPVYSIFFFPYSIGLMLWLYNFQSNVALSQLNIVKHVFKRSPASYSHPNFLPRKLLLCFKKTLWAATCQ